MDWIWFCNEFVNKKYRSMFENLNIDAKHKASDSPWKNGLCAENTAVTDSMLLAWWRSIKIFALIFYCYAEFMQKKCFHMNSGSCSYQLVSRHNPIYKTCYRTAHQLCIAQWLVKYLLNILVCCIRGKETFIKAESSGKKFLNITSSNLYKRWNWTLFIIRWLEKKIRFTFILGFVFKFAMECKM